SHLVLGGPDRHGPLPGPTGLRFLPLCPESGPPPAPPLADTLAGRRVAGPVCATRHLPGAGYPLWSRTQPPGALPGALAAEPEGPDTETPGAEPPRAGPDGTVVRRYARRPARAG